MLCASLYLTRYQLQFWENSIRLFQHAIQVTQDNVLAHYNLGLALGNENKFAQADFQLNEALRIMPRNPTINLQRGRLQLKAGNLEHSISYFNEVLAIEPNNLEAHYLLGKIHAMSAQAQSRDGILALTHAEYVCRNSPTAEARHLDLLAAAQAENGQFMEAIETMHRACALAQAAGMADKELRERIVLYKRGEPYRADFRHWKNLK
jgi:Flp pilus assembly protein TadD